MLTEADIIRYSRQIVLQDIGLEGQERLLNSTAAIIGLGGLGSPASMLLASMGIGKLILVDRDIVSKTDLHREPLYKEEDVELPKVEAAEKRIREINPSIKIELYPEPVNHDNVDEIVSKADVIIDGLDNMAARYIVNRAVVRHRKPYVFAGAIEMYGNVTSIIPHETPCLECFYNVYDYESLPTCATVGVHPSITFVIAAIEVEEAVQILINGRPKLYKKLLYIDLRTMDFEKISIERVETCPVCGAKPSGAPRDVSLPDAEVSCSRDGSAVYIVNKVDRGLDMESVSGIVKEMGWRVGRRSRYSLSFSIDSGRKAVILSSGVLIGLSKKHSEENLIFFKGLRDRLVRDAIHIR